MNRRASIYHSSAGHGRWHLKIVCSLVFLFTLSLRGQTLECTSMTFPANGESNVPVSSIIQWDPVANATSYSLFIGTSPGSRDIVDGTDIGYTLSYTPPSGWEPNTTYYVMVQPRNNSGSSAICEEKSFTTGAGGGIPGCAILNKPLNGSYGVPPNTAISWFPQNEAVGYILNIGTSAGNYDILDAFDVGDVTTYMPQADLPMSQRIYVSIIPYNTAGETPACSEYWFQTRNNSVPLCTEILDPINGAGFVSVTANITWIRDFNSLGYRMTIEEKSPGGLRIVDNEDVGSGTNYKPPDFLPNTTYYVTLVPYNDLGAAQNCSTISFTTGDAPDPPECSTLSMPQNGATDIATDAEIRWEAVSGARGYILSAGSSSGSNDLLNRLDVGLFTSYTFSDELPEGTRIFIRVIPYSNWGEAVNCQQWSFTTFKTPSTTENLPIPKFFTPNNDGYNDTWIVQSTTDIAVSRVSIFNRFGKLLKQLGAGQAWDGNFKGRPLSSDSYWYKIETSDGHYIVGYLLLKR